MKAKTLALTAIICAASIFGTSAAPVYAATQNTPISQINIQTEQKSKKVRDRNRAIAAVLGIAAIAAIANNHDRHSERNRNEDYNRGSKRTPPPPPPMPHRHNSR